jgi:hypothetical protein
VASSFATALRLVAAMEMDMIFVPLGAMPGLLRCNKKRGLITPGGAGDPRYFRRAGTQGMQRRLNADGH